MALSASAQKLTPNEVRHNAQQFVEQLTNNHSSVMKEVSLPSFERLSAFNLEGGGYVIASGDSRTRPILAYSRTGSIDTDDLPEGLLYWLGEYEQQIVQLGNTTLEEMSQASLNGKEAYSSKDFPDTVAPMLLTAWTQYRYGYNSLAPYDSVIAADSNMIRFDGRPTVGCMALAMAQIMRYWQYPIHGVGSHSYTYEGEYECWRYGTLSADFANATYDYANMPYKLSDSSTTAEVTAVATLASHCGISCNMMYNSDCAGSSGAQIHSALTGLQHFFHYSPYAHMEMKNYYSSSSWINMLKQDLSSGKPVLYCGQSYRNDADSTVDGGHAFVFDGYDARNYFHVNWGWNGSCDGYYSLDVLRPLTQYNFTNYQYCILELEPYYDPMPILTMASDLTLDSNIFDSSQPVSGSYSITNIGDSIGSLFFGVNIYGRNNSSYYGCLDGRRVNVAPGDTIVCPFSFLPNLPRGEYIALMQYSTDSFYAGITVDRTNYYADLEHVYQVDFSIVDRAHKECANLVLLARFADDPGFSQTFNNIQNLLNNGNQNLTTFFHDISYGKIELSTFYARQRQGSLLVPYTDHQPRAYYQPYSESNPQGYTSPYTFPYPHQREVELIENLCQYINNQRLVNGTVTLDLNNDGDIDNLIIIIQGDTDGSNDLLSPHAGVYPYDSLFINDKRVKHYNIIFEGSSSFTLPVLAHQMGRSLGLPELSHRSNYTHVDPVYYDIMAGNEGHPSAMFKHHYLYLTSEPVAITHDGSYTIYSLTTSATNNLYYIKSAIDTNQWYTIEYRTPDPGSEVALNQYGLLIGRWMDTVPLDPLYGGNAFFDNALCPNTYWVFRPDSDNDTIQGDVANCFFSRRSGRVNFGPSSNPHPYLSDGRSEHSFEIYDIQEYEDACTFSVRFLTQEVEELYPSTSAALYPNPSTGRILLQGIDYGTPVKVYNLYGAQVYSTTYSGRAIDLSSLPAGMYILTTPTYNTKIIKQ